MNKLDAFVGKAARLDDVSVSHEGNQVVATSTGWDDEDTINTRNVCDAANGLGLEIIETEADFDAGSETIVVVDPEREETEAETSANEEAVTNGDSQ